MVDSKSGGSKGQNEIGPRRSFSRAVLTRTVTTVRAVVSSVRRVSQICNLHSLSC